MTDVSLLSVQAHLTYRLANSVIRKWPFPHAYFENVFPDDFYAGLMETMPGPSDYAPVSKVRAFHGTKGKPAYPDRFVITMDEQMADLGSYWNAAMQVIRTRETAVTLLDIFQDSLHQRLTDNPPLEPDALLIRDRTNYALGPHTDNPIRYVVFIVYLPETAENEHLGTTLYVPNKLGLTCPGGPHYDRKDFSPAFTSPYRPNSALAFVKTDNSFHGVEPVAEGKERNIIHYFLKKSNG